MTYEQNPTKQIISVFICCLFIFWFGYICGNFITQQEPNYLQSTKTSSGQQIHLYTTGTKSGEKGTIKSTLRGTGYIQKSGNTGYRYTTGITTKNDTTKIQPTKLMSNKTVLVKGFPKDSQATKIATYAYRISSGNMDFLMTLKAENGGFDMYKQSNVVKNGHREESYGLCQMMRKYHKEVNTKIFWESWQYQVELCYQKYISGTKFYGYYVRKRYKKDFIFRN